LRAIFKFLEDKITCNLEITGRILMHFVVMNVDTTSIKKEIFHLDLSPLELKLVATYRAQCSPGVAIQLTFNWHPAAFARLMSMIRVKWLLFFQFCI